MSGHRRSAAIISFALICAITAGCARPVDTTDARQIPAVSSTSATLVWGSAAVALARLPIKGRAPLTGYDRDEFGPAWTDDNTASGGRNGCDTRNDVLARDLTADVIRPGTRCVVLRGRLLDPYSGVTIAFTRGRSTSSRVQIDHVVALADAWQKGAQQLSRDRRRALANDPLELLAVSGSLNQAKGAGDAATWLPPRRAYRCAYVARQIAVKRAYALWITTAERNAMRRVLGTCPAQPLPAR